MRLVEAQRYDHAALVHDEITDDELNLILARAEASLRAPWGVFRRGT
jgi:hypothetical protein